MYCSSPDTCAGRTQIAGRMGRATQSSWLYVLTLCCSSLPVTTPLKSTDGPEPTREYTMNIPDGTIVDHHGDQSLGPAPPLSPTQDGSVSVSVHQEDHQPVPIKRDHGASQSTLLSLGPPSPSQSERRFRVCSKSESSCLENPKFPRDRVSLLMDNDVAEEEVTPVLENLDPPKSEYDDSNSETRGGNTPV